MEVVAGLVHCLECGDHDREILRQTARHYGIHRRRVNRQFQAGRGMLGNHGLARAAFIEQHRLNPLHMGRHDRQAVSPPLFEAIVDGGQNIVRHLVDLRSVKRHGRRILRLIKQV